MPTKSDGALEQRLIALSLISTAVEREQDVFEYFFPLVGKAISDLGGTNTGTRLSITQVRDHLLQLYSVNVPLNTMHSLINRAAARFKYTAPGNRESFVVDHVIRDNQTEVQNERLRNINELVKDFVQFSLHYGIVVSEEDARKTFIELFRSSGSRLSTYVVGEVANIGSSVATSITEALRLPVVDYLQKIRFADQRKFTILREIYLSVSLISLLESSAGLNELPGFRSRSKVYLDTNFVLRLLNWQTEYERVAAHELYETLMVKKADLLVLSYTIEETLRALDFYGREAFDLLSSPVSRHLRESELNRVVSAVRRRNLTRSQFLKAIAEIESNLKQLGIRIIETGRLEQAHVDDSGLDELVALKLQSGSGTEQSEQYATVAARHDMAAINVVKRERRDRVFTFRQAHVWFLTSDHRLCKFNREQHRGRKSIPEAILDHTLSDLLWLASPQKMTDLAVDQFISHIVLDSTYDARFLRHVDGFVKRYFETKPEDLAYAEEAFQAIQLNENKREFVRIQNSHDEKVWNAALQAKIEEAVISRKQKDEKLINEHLALGSVLDDMRNTTKQAIKRLEGQNAELRTALDSIMAEVVETSTRHDDESTRKRQQMAELRSWLILLSACLASAVIWIAMNTIGYASSWWRLLAFLPFIGMYAWLHIEKPESNVMKVVYFMCTFLVLMWTLFSPYLTK